MRQSLPVSFDLNGKILYVESAQCIDLVPDRYDPGIHRRLLLTLGVA